MFIDLQRLKCGEGGIRTPGAFQLNSFQDCRNRPLYHLSSMSNPLCGSSLFSETDCKGSHFLETCKFYLQYLKKITILCGAGPSEC